MSDYVPFVPPSYAEAYQEGLKRGYDHARTEGDLETVADSPGWVAGNLELPYANGWKAGVESYLYEEAGRHG